MLQLLGLLILVVVGFCFPPLGWFLLFLVGISFLFAD